MNLLGLILSKMAEKSLDSFIFMNTNEHLSEFISDADMHIKELTGFTGSNAKVIVTDDESRLFTDGRYFLQAEKELVDPFKLEKTDSLADMAEFLREKVGTVGIDDKLISNSDFKILKSKLDGMNIKIIPTDIAIFKDVWKKTVKPGNTDLIDLETYKFDEYITFNKNMTLKRIFNDLFSDKYKYEHSEMMNRELIPGISCENKIKILKRGLKVDEGLVLNTLDAVAWLLNLRGTEIAQNTVFSAHVYINKRKVIVFTDYKLPRNLDVQPYKNFYDFLKKVEEKKVFVQNNINRKIVNLLGEDKIVPNDSFDKLKSVKNGNEIAGFFQAGILDGVSLVKLFVWLQSAEFLSQKMKHLIN